MHQAYPTDLASYSKRALRDCVAMKQATGRRWALRRIKVKPPPTTWLMGFLLWNERKITLTFVVDELTAL